MMAKRNETKSVGSKAPRRVGDLPKRPDKVLKRLGTLHKPPGTVVVGVIDEARRRRHEQERQAQSATIERLEEKVGRLVGELEEAERQRDAARAQAQALEARGDPGLSGEEEAPSRAGLSRDDPRRAAKMAIMKELLEQNRELRRALGLALAGAQAGAVAVEIVAVEVSGELEIEAAMEVNPDDLPWQPSEEAAAPTDDGDAGGVKIMRHFKHFDPPPLVKR
jgi:hypothetical protein